MKRLIREELDKVEIKEVHSIGERSVLVKVENQQDKSNTLKNKYKLRKITSETYILTRI